MTKNRRVCDCHPLDKALVEKTKALIPNRMLTQNLAEFFGILGDHTRCKILFALQETPLCVCDLANVLSMTKSSISHQLNKLKAAGIVKCERHGKQVVYSLDDDHIATIFAISFTHIQENRYEK